MNEDYADGMEVTNQELPDDGMMSSLIDYRIAYAVKIDTLTLRLEALTPPDMKDEVRAALRANLQENASLTEALETLIDRMARTGNPWPE